MGLPQNVTTPPLIGRLGEAINGGRKSRASIQSKHYVESKSIKFTYDGPPTTFAALDLLGNTPGC